MQSAKCKVQSAKCKVQNAKCKVQSAKSTDNIRVKGCNTTTTKSIYSNNFTASQ
jgi:hypothetical protein